MKNRKTVIVAFLLIAVMLLSVGYAELTNQLFINTELGATTDESSEEFDGDIYFYDKSITLDDTNKATCVITANDTAEITASQFTKKDQTVKVVLTIRNDSTEFDAKVVANAVLNTQHVGVFSATCEWLDENGDPTSNLNETVIAGNQGTAKVLVTLKLLETPVDAHSATFNVTFDVTAQDMSSGG